MMEHQFVLQSQLTKRQLVITCFKLAYYDLSLVLNCSGEFYLPLYLTLKLSWLTSFFKHKQLFNSECLLISFHYMFQFKSGVQKMKFLKPLLNASNTD